MAHDIRPVDEVEPIFGYWLTHALGQVLVESLEEDVGCWFGGESVDDDDMCRHVPLPIWLIRSVIRSVRRKDSLAMLLANGERQTGNLGQGRAPADLPGAHFAVLLATRKVRAKSEDGLLPTP